MEFVIAVRLFVKRAQLADRSVFLPLLINEERLYVKQHGGLSSSLFRYLVFVSAAELLG